MGVCCWDRGSWSPSSCYWQDNKREVSSSFVSQSQHWQRVRQVIGPLTANTSEVNKTRVGKTSKWEGLKVAAKAAGVAILLLFGEVLIFNSSSKLLMKITLKSDRCVVATLHPQWREDVGPILQTSYL